MMRVAARPSWSVPTLAIIALLAVVAVVVGVPGAIGGVLASGRTETVPSGPPAGARLTFSDAFEGVGLDSTKWITCYPWASTSGCTNASTSELEWYDPQGVSVSGGALHLTAQRQQISVDHRQYGFTSGMVATAGKFQFTYGYVEFQARVPSGRGLWPALWLLPANESWPPEIDAMEVLGGNPRAAALTYHPVHGRPERRQVKTADLSVGWHDFAIDWQPGSITWFVDGRARYSVKGTVPSQPMYLVMDLAVNGSQRPDQSTPFPSSFDINYVRVWEPG